MRVKYLIEQLKEYDPDDEIIVAYWDRDHVAMNLNRVINDDQWGEILLCLDNLDWWDNFRWVVIETLNNKADNE